MEIIIKVEKSDNFEYDHLETSTNPCSIDNLSSTTSYSDILEGERQNQIRHYKEFLNKHELISRSSMITQELEARLKERRQVIENKNESQFRPKMLKHIDILEMSANQMKQRADTEDSLENLCRHKMDSGM